MTITAANFTVKNANAQDISNLNAALAYLSNSSDAVTVLQGMIANGTQINIIHNGDDGFVPATSTSPGVINWDPDSGSIVVNANGQMIGTQSAALGLIHEGGHATDPNLAADANTPNQQYGKRGQSHLLTMSLPGDRLALS